jgi:hypothetical protein
MTPNTPTSDGSPAADKAPEPTPFARLLRELDDLDFAQIPGDGHVTATYAMVDRECPLVVEFDNTTTPATAHLVHGRVDQPPTWRVSITAATPDPVQVMVLRAALNAHLDPQAALDEVAKAMGVSLANEQPPSTGA